MNKKTNYPVTEEAYKIIKWCQLKASEEGKKITLSESIQWLYDRMKRYEELSKINLLKDNDTYE